MSGEVDVIFLDHRCISHEWDSWNRRELGSSGSASLMNLGNDSKDPLHLLKSQHGIIVCILANKTATEGTWFFYHIRKCKIIRINIHCDVTLLILLSPPPKI